MTHSLDILNEEANVQSIPVDLHGQLLDYVNQHCCSSSLCLNSVADYMETSIYAVSRTFKELTGVGFREYVTGRRLQRACQLLSTTNHTIGEIAVQSGFENATYFTTVFKNEYGIPPSKYRTITRKNSQSDT